MVTFDGINKRIEVTGVDQIDVQRDIYSGWKRWAVQSNNTKYLQAIRPVGGDDIGGGQKSPAFFFLMNDWKILVDGISVNFSLNLYAETATNQSTFPFDIRNGGSVSSQQSNSPIVTTGSGVTAQDKIDIADAVALRDYEGDLSQEEILKIILAAVAGSSFGAGTANFGYKSADGSKNRIESTFDLSGNRTIQSLDGS